MIRSLRRPAWPASTAGDAVLALLLFVASTIELVSEPKLDGSLAVNVVAVAVVTAPLAWRRRRPFAVTVAMIVAASVQAQFLTSTADLAAIFVALLVVAYTSAAHLPRPLTFLALPVMLAGIVGVNVGAGDVSTGDYVFPATVVTLCWLAGRAVRARTLLTEELHEAAIRAQEAHEAEAQRASAEERRRIAREMHDVVAHSVSVMVIQAGGARRIIERDPERAAQAAAQIEFTGRAALVEMRRLLGLLHIGEGAELAPQPSLAELDALVARSRAAGLPVALRVVGEPRALPAGVDLAAYRIVQEALTNTLKHAGATAAEVRVSWGEDELDLEILDRGQAGSDPHVPAVTGGGHGLVGMGERVRLYGGELEAGQRPGGGFRVRARLPLEERERVSA